MHRLRRWVLLSIFAALPVMSLAQTLIPLTPANVIGASGNLGANFLETNVLDMQSGPVTEVAYTYWLGREATPNEYFVIDLGAAYSISQIELFNTHNWFSGDRTTNAFTISASNTVSGFDLVSPTQILSGTLPYSTSNTIAPATYTAGNGLSTGTGYRYVQFTAVSYGGSSSGLNEIRVYAIPESGAVAAIAGGVVLAGACLRRRRTMARL
jgi:hypothetical protein